MPDIPSSFPTKTGRKAFYKYNLLAGTNGLLAITRESESVDWRITHVATGFAFPFEFVKYEEAVRAATKLYKNFPRNQLAEKTPQAVVGSVSTKQVLKMMGME